MEPGGGNSLPAVNHLNRFGMLLDVVKGHIKVSRVINWNSWSWRCHESVTVFMKECKWSKKNYFGVDVVYQTSRYPYKGSSWVFSNWVWHKVGRTHLALQNAWVYSKLGRSKCFSNYLNFRAKNISKYKLLHSRVDPTQKVSQFPGSKKMK